MRNRLQLLLIAAFLSFLVSSAVTGALTTREKSTDALERAGFLKINKSQCIGDENKLGQLLYVNVDNFCSKQPCPRGAINPTYQTMVKNLQLGGVLPHSGSFLFKDQKSDFQDMQASSNLPLMIGVDYDIVDPTGTMKDLYDTAQNDIHNRQFGMGRAGYIEEFGPKSDQCLSANAFISAFLHKVVGINQALGPTVDNSTLLFKQSGYQDFLGKDSSFVNPKVKLAQDQFSSEGVVTTVKHFPFRGDFDLHKTNTDIPLDQSEIDKNIDIFKKSAGNSDFVMTTHIYDSKLDPDNVVTFSEKWINVLRKDVGFNGLVVTDALFMFEKYPDSMKKMCSKWPQDQVAIDPKTHAESIFAARAILAGHDMAFLEGNAGQTYQVFNDLLKTACSGTDIGNKLHARIQESYARIASWKKNHENSLRQNLSVDPKFVQTAVELNQRRVCSDSQEFQAFKRTVDSLGIIPNSHSNPTGNNSIDTTRGTQ